MSVHLAERRRRGWQTLVWSLAAFAAIQVVLSAVMERWQPGLRDREYGVKLKRLRERLAEPGRRPVILVIGSSRVATGLKTMQLLNKAEAGPQPLVFNAGIRGAGPLMELITLQRILAEGVKPECVVFEFWPPACCQEDERLALCRMGWADGLLARNYTDDPNEFTRRWLQERVLPCYNSRFTIMNQVARRWVTADDGWDHRLDGGGWRANPVPKSRERSAELLKKSWAIHGPNLREFRVPDNSDRALRESLRLCRERWIRTALLFMPEAKGFQPCYPPEVWANAHDYLLTVARESGSDVIDCRDWMGDEDFADGYHMLPSGAERFTTRFGREVVPRLARLSQGVR